MEKPILCALFLSSTAPLFPRLTSYKYSTKHERKTHQKLRESRMWRLTKTYHVLVFLRVEVQSRQLTLTSSSVNCSTFSDNWKAGISNKVGDMLPLLCVPVGETGRAPLICGSESGRWPTKAAAAGAIMPEDGE